MTKKEYGIIKDKRKKIFILNLKEVGNPMKIISTIESICQKKERASHRAYTGKN